MNDKIVSLYKELLNKELESAQKKELKGKSFFDLIREGICVPSTYQKGRNYKNGGIMIVGQAKNGWDNSRNLNMDDLLNEMMKNANDPTKQYYLADPRGVERDESSNKTGDRWHVKTSRYEKMVYCVVTNSNNIDNITINAEEEKLDKLLQDSWPQTMVETELFKISPSEGGNPTGAIATCQLDLCIQILKAEIEYFKPSRILFGTGKNKLDDLSKSFELNEKKNTDYILASGHYNNIKIVIAKRPDDYKENFSDDQIIEQAKCIREEFKKC